jgi:hypothetical protein
MESGILVRRRVKSLQRAFWQPLSATSVTGANDGRVDEGYHGGERDATWANVARHQAAGAIGTPGRPARRPCMA